MNIRGTLVFASGRSADFDIWTLDLVTAELNQLTYGKFLNDTPVWSLDGSQIAFISTQEDTVPSLWTMNRDGSNQRRLTENVFCRNPAWHPDGKRVVLTANAEDSNEIEVVAADICSGKLEVLFRRHGVESDPSISPDGKKIVFTTTARENAAAFSIPNTDVYEYDLETAKERRLTTHPAKDYSPVYSPDGRRIAFVSHRNGRAENEYFEQLKHIIQAVQEDNLATINRTIRKIQAMEHDSELCLMDLDGSNLRELTNNSRVDLGARWSPCGKYLVYCSAPGDEKARGRLRIIDIASGKSVPVQFDRTRLSAEVDADPVQVLNRTIIQKLVPDFIEKYFCDPSFWGEERRPDWTYN